VHTSHVRAVGGGEEIGPSPVDRSKLGTKHALLIDGQGLPLVIDPIVANTPDVHEAVPLVGAVPPIAEEYTDWQGSLRRSECPLA
jgi:hypothetical protein